MQLVDLERYQQQHKSELPPKLKKLVPELNEYLERALERSQDAERHADIVPVTLAKKLSIDEALALALLMISENAGVVTPEYHVLCPETGDVLGEFKSIDELPESIRCPYHESGEVEHGADDYDVDLVFHFTPKVLRKYVRASKG